MTTLEKQYATYRSQLRKLTEQKDAWYTVANQKFSEGDEDGQDRAYDEIDAIQEKIDALINPLGGKLVNNGNRNLEFDS